MYRTHNLKTITSSNHATLLRYQISFVDVVVEKKKLPDFTKLALELRRESLSFYATSSNENKFYKF